MHSISLVAVGILLAITICPYNTNGTTTENTELEEPVMMALSSKPEEKTPYKREVWQESEGEVLIRNERGTKENGSGSTTGKKQNKKDNKNPNNTKNAHKQQHLNKTSDTYSKSENIPSTTQETVRKHQQKHEKHENKMNSNSNKKHASTDKQKHKDESKRK